MEEGQEGVMEEDGDEDNEDNEGELMEKEWLMKAAAVMKEEGVVVVVEGVEEEGRMEEDGVTVEE